MTIVDIEAIEHLDFDVSDEEPCQAEGCEAAPVWQLTLTCCFWSLKICNSCLGQHERWLDIMVLFSSTVSHKPCGTTWTAKDMKERELVVPL